MYIAYISRKNRAILCIVIAMLTSSYVFTSSLQVDRGMGTYTTCKNNLLVIGRRLAQNENMSNVEIGAYICPAAGVSTYKIIKGDHGQMVICQGLHHQPWSSLTNYPQYDSNNGLIEAPPTSSQSEPPVVLYSFLSGLLAGAAAWWLLWFIAGRHLG